MALSSHEKGGELIKDDYEERRYNTIIDIMATEDLKISAKKMMDKIMSRPPHKRYSLAKGPRPEKKFTSQQTQSKREPEETNFEKMYIDGVLIDKRDPNDLELIDEQCKLVDMFNTDVFKRTVF